MGGTIHNSFSLKTARAFATLKRYGTRQQPKWQARGGYPVPRVHDIRHTFVCRQLGKWSRAGSVDSNILALSAYFGHVKVRKTYRWNLDC